VYQGTPQAPESSGGWSVHPLSLDRLLAIGWSLFRFSWLRMLVAAAAAIVPGYLVLGAAAAAFAPQINAWLADAQAAASIGLQPPPWPPGMSTGVAVLFGGAIVLFVLSAVAGGAVIHITDATYRGRRPSVADALAHAAGRLPALIGAQLVYILIAFLIMLVGLTIGGLLILGGSVLAFVGLVVIVGSFAAWIFVAIRTSLVMPVIILESAGAIEGLARSWRLVAGSGWRILGYVLLIGLLAVIAGLVISTVPGLILRLDSGTSGGVATSSMLDALSSIVLTPLTAIVFSLLYYDLRWKSGEPVPTPGAEAGR